MTVMMKRRALGLLTTVLLTASALGCGADGGSFASGGMSGSGISEGSISAFGSIFVNGVEWEVDDASIDIEGVAGGESDLRLGMVVRVEGNLAEDGLTGNATSVHFDDALEGPIAEDPTPANAEGTRKEFSVLDTRVVVDVDDTVFDDGASFDGLARDQVVEVSGFIDETGAVRATRVELQGEFPTLDDVELRGRVSGLSQDMSDGGIFDLGGITVHYTAATDFEDGTRDDLAEGVLVEVEGRLRISGDEIDAAEIELEEEGLGDGDADDVELEGFVTGYLSDAFFLVSGVQVDASGASFDPTSLALANGVQVEVEGRLQAGILIADRVEAEGDDDPDEDEPRVKIKAAVSAVASSPNRLTLLGVELGIDADTELEDERDELPNFRFSDIAVGDWMEIEAVATGVAAARALSVHRKEPDDDVVLQGPVTALDTLTPTLEVLDQPIPLDGATSYFDVLDAPRSEEEFFRNPGDVMLGDTVKVSDESAADAAVLSEADEVEIED